MGYIDMQEMQHRICEVVDALHPLIEDIAVSLYSRPELGLEEIYAAGKLAGIRVRWLRPQ